MASFISFIKTKKYPTRDTFIKLFEGPFSWYTAALYVAIIVFIVSGYLLLISMNNHFLVRVPARGGSLTEGVIGAPHFINPILAATDTDIGLTKLIYAGLTKKAPDGTIVTDMAESYTISPDGKNYQISLKKGVRFHNKTIMTAADVRYTFELLKDESLDPINATYWQDIQIEEIDPYTVTFHLPQADTAFLGRLTVGIMPHALWSTIPNNELPMAAANLSPVGTGAFAFKAISYTNNIPTSITLAANTHYVPTPYLSEVTIQVFANQEELARALNTDAINFTSSLLPSYTGMLTNNTLTVVHIPTDTMVGLFRTKSEPTLEHTSIVNILNQFIDKNNIIATVETGYGTSLDTQAEHRMVSSDDALSQLKLLGYALDGGILKKKGVPVRLTIAVENNESMLAVADMVRQSLGTIGIGVSIQAFDQGTFQTGVRAGEYHLIIANSSDTTIPPGYQSVIPLYTKLMPYVIDKEAQGITDTIPTSVRDRYATSTKWYAYTEKLWPWFIPNDMRHTKTHAN